VPHAPHPNTFHCPLQISLLSYIYNYVKGAAIQSVAVRNLSNEIWRLLTARSYRRSIFEVLSSKDLSILGVSGTEQSCNNRL